MIPGADSALPPGGAAPVTGAAREVTIGPLYRSDAERCAELERVLFAGDDPWSARAFRDEVGAGVPYFAARAGGRLVGYAGLGFVAGPAEPADALLSAEAANGTVDALLSAEAADGTVDALLSAEAADGTADALFPAEAADGAEAEVHTIGVDPAFQGRGIGRRLLDALLEVADAVHATVFLEVRTDNEPAQRLYAATGFTVVGLRKRYYRPSGADAYTMRRDPR